MALDELLIEELGFGPVWVRRRPDGVPASETAASRVAVPEPAIAREQTLAASADANGSGESPSTATRVAAPTAPQSRDANRANPWPVENPRAAALKADPPAHEPPIDPQAGEAPPSAGRAPTPQSSDANRPAPTPQDFDAPPFEAYDDLPWTDDAPFFEPPAAPEPADDIRTLDWTALSERVSGCERCRLCERRTHAVFGVGDREADWMLIGEAPGENEDKQGEPFVGQAGKLLDNMLRSLALSRESNVYIANVIKCRPPGNRNPEPDEVARCEPYLQRQVELVKPKVIVALGRFAAQSLLKSEGSIASLRGRVHEYRGVPVVVTYHPAYLLRSLPDKAKAWADLCLARKTYQEALAALGVQAGAGKGER